MRDGNGVGPSPDPTVGEAWVILLGRQIQAITYSILYHLEEERVIRLIVEAEASHRIPLAAGNRWHGP